MPTFANRMPLTWVFILLSYRTAVGEPAKPMDDRVVVQPEQTDEMLANPDIGWETFGYTATKDRNLPNWLPSSLCYVRWGWGRIEPRPGSIDMDLINGMLAEARAAGQKLAVRVKGCNPRKGAAEHPAWLKDVGGRELLVDYGGGPAEISIPDMDDPVVLERHLDFIKRLGAQYDGHPDLARIEIGSIGWWGEWHLSRSTMAKLPSIDHRHAVIAAYRAAFTQTPLLMPNPANECIGFAVSRGIGWRADSLGDLGSFSPTWNHMRDAYPTAIRRNKLQDAWKTAPVSFEAPENVSEFVARDWPVRSIFNYALALHGSSFNGKSAPLPEGQPFRQELERFVRRLGYRFALGECAHPAQATAGGLLHISSVWRNVGSAVCYRPYRVAYRLTGPDGSHSVLIGTATVNTWLPGSTELFTAAFPENVPDLPLGDSYAVHDSMRLPAELLPRDYTLAIGIVAEASEAPVIRLPLAGRDQDGWYPLSQLTIIR